MFSLKKYFRQWASRRSPRADNVVLQHRTIYVFPSKQGAGFLLVVLVIWVMGTNYQNNLILGFSFLLTSVMLVSIVHAFKNLLGLRFSAGAMQYAEVGELAAFDIVVSSQYLSVANGLIFEVDGGETVTTELESGKTISVCVGLQAKQRGFMKLPRITLKSYFPFGLIRAWAYIDLNHRALIFPKPIACLEPPLGVVEGETGNNVTAQQGDEFYGFQKFIEGAPLSQVAWKQYARGAGMHLKDYRALQSPHYWLDWQQWNGRETELGLSNLSYWVNEYANNNIEFGLLLPHKTIAMGQGDKHRLEALTALALFGWVDND